MADETKVDGVDGTLTPEERIAADKAGMELNDPDATNSEEDSSDSNADDSTDSERPAWLPEKFKDVEAFVKSSAAAEKKISEQGKELKELKGDGKPKDGEDGADDKTTPKLQGILESVAERFLEKGELTDEDFKEMSDAGLPRSHAELHVKGIAALQELQVMKVHNLVGGEESFNNMTKWAGENLTETQMNAFDKAVLGDDFEIAQLAIAGLHAQFTNSQGSDAKSGRVTGKQNAGGLKPYVSDRDLTRDMNSPEYENDPAFRQKVQERLAISKLAG